LACSPRGSLRRATDLACGGKIPDLDTAYVLVACARVEAIVLDRRLYAAAGQLRSGMGAQIGAARLL